MCITVLLRWTVCYSWIYLLAYIFGFSSCIATHTATRLIWWYMNTVYAVLCMSAKTVCANNQSYCCCYCAAVLHCWYSHQLLQLQHWNHHTSNVFQQPLWGPLGQLNFIKLNMWCVIVLLVWVMLTVSNCALCACVLVHSTRCICFYRATCHYSVSIRIVWCNVMFAPACKLTLLHASLLYCWYATMCSTRTLLSIL
jgi:hypothetical protein